MNLMWRNPPAHHWYAAKSPGLSLQCRSSKAHQTALARFRSDHLRSMTFVRMAQRYLGYGSHCEAVAVLTCPKPIPKLNLVPRFKHNTTFVGFTRVNNQGERNTSMEMLKSVRVEEWYKISIDETNKLIKSLPNMLRTLLGGRMEYIKERVILVTELDVVAVADGSIFSLRIFLIVEVTKFIAAPI
ncbi:uncharacterized protein TNCV_5055811 [Trichonephila clavipes]|nr:uncharacterized protein TNCV_5055811 [Trichonephila clavipes]